MMVGCIPSHAAYFSVYEQAKVALGVNLPGHSPIAAAACGALATTLHDAVLTPVDVVKQRLQLGFYKGIWDCVRTILREEGPRALYRSYPTTLLMNWPYAGVLVATNESIKQTLLRRNGSTGEPLGMLEFLLSGAVSGAVAAAITTPLDVLKTRLQTQGLAVAAPLPSASSTPSQRAGSVSSAGSATGSKAPGSSPRHLSRETPPPSGPNAAPWTREGRVAWPRPFPEPLSRPGVAAGGSDAGSWAQASRELFGRNWEQTGPRRLLGGLSGWAQASGQGWAGVPGSRRLSRFVAAQHLSARPSAGAARRLAMGLGGKGCSRLWRGGSQWVHTPAPAARSAQPWRRTDAGSVPSRSLSDAARDDAIDAAQSRAGAASERDVATARATNPRPALRMGAGQAGFGPVRLVQRAAAPQYTGMGDAAVKVLAAEGVRGLFRGLLPRMAVHTPSAAISWGTYEALKNALRPVTG